jgi:hypothetical protein
MQRLAYDLQFTKDELKRIKWLRRLDANRSFYSWSAGVSVLLLVFFVQVPFHGVQLVHVICTYGCLPAGLATGVWLNCFIDRFVDREFESKWDPLFFERSGKTPAQIAAQEEVLALANRLEFLALSVEEQREIVQRINKKYGL